ncbi:Pyoverdine/dityrosine biosynthesis protein-domain-containing protein [Phaeosphaeriaceae sp. PMI808]|nr:Pyoverdine/dityrosine biosynthesis protein-domain-containing protein [Phaeosphaeriaceae sp. PMI808]
MHPLLPMTEPSGLQRQPRSPVDIANTKPHGETPTLLTNADVSSEPTSRPCADDSSDGLHQADPTSSNVPTTRDVQHSIYPISLSLTSKNDTHIATKILQIIESYGIQGGSTNAPWCGLVGYMSLVTEQIRASKPIQILFSGFPFKSPHVGDLVLGDLPDLGEKLALGQLNSLALNISEVYAKGAEIHICSEGLVYNDILGISDETVWIYGDTLRAMAEQEGFRHLRFLQLWDILGNQAGNWTKEYALTHIPCIQRELFYRYASISIPPDSHCDEDISDGILDYFPDVFSPNRLEGQVKLMQSLRARMTAYSSALDANKADYIRLSSHKFGHTRGGNTLIMPLLPPVDEPKTLAPWNSTIAVDLDGRFRPTHTSELQDLDTYELILDTSGTKSHYRAKSDMWDWKADGLNVTFEHLYPTGIMIRPISSKPGATPSILTLPMRKLRCLSQNFSPIILRGFSETTNEESFQSKGQELGDVQTSTFVNTVDRATGIVAQVSTPPGYQYFNCVKTPPSNNSYTLFASSRLFFQHLPSPFSLLQVQNATWSTEHVGSGSAKQSGLPLVIRHAETGAPCLHWHQSWENAKTSEYLVAIENDEVSGELVGLINKLVHDHRVCLRFCWEQGDLLVNDNISTLYAKAAFVETCEREVWVMRCT